MIQYFWCSNDHKLSKRSYGPARVGRSGSSNLGRRVVRPKSPEVYERNKSSCRDIIAFSAALFLMAWVATLQEPRA